MPEHWTKLHEVAKQASLDASRNSGAVPQLLFAPILWALQRALAEGMLTDARFTPVDEGKATGSATKESKA